LLIAWAGDDPMREGLRDTPARVVRSYEEMFSGYASDPRSVLSRTFGEAGGYQEPVILRNIRLVSCCEHHMLPVTGKAHIGYLPNTRVVGISKLSRVVEGFARRLQIQERLVVEIANAIQDVIDPRGVAVVVEAEHSCMTLRGVKTPDAAMICTHFMGDFRDSADLRAEFLRMVGF
jgi:GTP cyclohydrolase I